MLIMVVGVPVRMDGARRLDVSCDEWHGWQKGEDGRNRSQSDDWWDKKSGTWRQSDADRR